MCEHASGCRMSLGHLEVLVELVPEHEDGLDLALVEVHGLCQGLQDVATDSRGRHADKGLLRFVAKNKPGIIMLMLMFNVQYSMFNVQFSMYIHLA